MPLSQLTDDDFIDLYGEWSPHTPADAAELLAGYPGDWWVVGGWAVEAFTGVPRSHEDVDIALRRDDLDALRAHLSGQFHIWDNAMGTLRPILAGDPDDRFPREFLQLWLRRDAASPWEYDIICDPSQRGQWVNRRLPSMSLPLDQATWVAADGIRYINPEILLLFKARGKRDKDERDFDVSLPLLSTDQRTWLRETLTQVHPGHHWLERLG